MPWNKLVHLGDIAITVPAAAAITSWLMATRAWRMAFWWSFLFVVGIGLVAASKVAFLGWGHELEGLDFKALSGHATGVTAVAPTLLYLLLQQHSAALRMAGVAVGLAFGLSISSLLVVLEHHSLSEALAGFLMGALISLGGIRMASDVPSGKPLTHWICFGLVFLAAAWLMKSAPVGYWMIRAALVLSGNSRPYAWDSD